MLWNLSYLEMPGNLMETRFSRVGSDRNGIVKYSTVVFDRCQKAICVYRRRRTTSSSEHRSSDHPANVLSAHPVSAL